MKKQELTDLTQIGPAEAEKQRESTKYLKDTAKLIGDVESLYTAIGPLVIMPDGDVDTPDQLALFVSVAGNQLVITRMLFTKSMLAILRLYLGEALTHLRRAIETCACTVRMSKHTELVKVWCEGGFPDNKKYRAYREAFPTWEIFPKEGYADFDPRLKTLRGTYDLSSKLIHGSIFGSSSHFVLGGSTNPRVKAVSLSDLPPELFPSSYFMILNTHLTILDLYGQVFKPHLSDFPGWISSKH